MSKDELFFYKKKKILVRETIKNERDSNDFRRMGMESAKEEEIETELNFRKGTKNPKCKQENANYSLRGHRSEKEPQMLSVSSAIRNANVQG